MNQGNDTGPRPTASLEARYYTDPENYEREKATLLARTWQFACHVSAVENAGDFVTFAIAGENLFCIRGKDGEVRTFYNVCRHRAHELVTDKGNKTLLVCPYHAWTYELNGALRGGPNLSAVPGLDKGSICLTGVRTEIFCGFVFVNLDDDAKPMDDWFPGVREQLRAYVPHVDGLKPLEWVEVPEACNWKVSVENYSECYHCAINHKTFVNGVVNPDTYDIQPHGHALWHMTESQNLDRMSYAFDPDANPHAKEYRSWFLWPTFSFQVYPGNVLNTYHWCPVDVGHVVVWRGWYSPAGEEWAVARQLARQDRESTVAEDMSLVEAVQRGLMSRGYRPGPLVIDPAGGLESEHSVKALQQWMRDGVATRSDLP